MSGILPSTESSLTPVGPEHEPSLSEHSTSYESWLTTFGSVTCSLGSRLRAAGQLLARLHWTSHDLAHWQLLLCNSGAVAAAVFVIDSGGLASSGKRYPCLQAAAWKLIAAVVLHEEAADDTVQQCFPALIALAGSTIQDARADRALVLACLLALNNLCFSSPEHRVRLQHLSQAVLAWATQQHVGHLLAGTACLFLSNLAKDVKTHSCLSALGPAQVLAPLVMDLSAPLQRRGPAMAFLSRLDSPMRAQLLAAGAFSSFFIPTMRAAVERREGPAGTLPGLDHAEHFALLCDAGGDGCSIVDADAARCCARCASDGVVALLQDVLTCRERTSSRRTDLEGKRFALEALGHIARYPVLRPKLRMTKRKPADAMQLKLELCSLQSSDRIGIRAAAARLFRRLRQDWIVSVLVCGQRLELAGQLPPGIWSEYVLSFVVQ